MLYLFLLAHLVADFMLQPLWLVLRKRRWDGLLIHVGIVVVCMLPIPLLVPTQPNIWWAIAWIGAVHFCADWWKVNLGDKLMRTPLQGFILDQVIHVATLIATLGMALPAEQVWSLAHIPFADLVIVASALIIAAFATPVGVIVGMDPCFQHAALAGKARTRSMFSAACAFMLALIAGPLAAPLTLFGFAAVSYRPASPHPLDRPTGAFVVLSVAASLGAVLAMLVMGG